MHKVDEDYPFSNSKRLVITYVWQISYDKFILSIAYWATVSIGESVYVIGGITGGSPDRIPTIAEYKGGIWEHIGDLEERRYHAVAISLGSTMMIVGGAG